MPPVSGLGRTLELMEIRVFCTHLGGFGDGRRGDEGLEVGMGGIKRLALEEGGGNRVGEGEEGVHLCHAWP